MRWIALTFLLIGCAAPKIAPGPKTDTQLMREDGIVRCEGYCYTEAQKFSEVLMFGPGGCVCDNPDGWRMRRAMQNFVEKK